MGDETKHRRGPSLARLITHCPSLCLVADDLCLPAHDQARRSYMSARARRGAYSRRKRELTMVIGRKDDCARRIRQSCRPIRLDDFMSG
jgi:hypothetical protein